MESQSQVETSKVIAELRKSHNVIKNPSCRHQMKLISNNIQHECWVRDTFGSEAFRWIRILPKEKNEMIEQMVQSWESDMKHSIGKLDEYDLKLRLDQLELPSSGDLTQLQNRLITAQNHLWENSSHEQVVHLMKKLGLDYNVCEDLDECIQRLMAAVWYGPTKLNDGFVRVVNGKHDLTTVSAINSTMPLPYFEGYIGNDFYQIYADKILPSYDLEFRSKSIKFRELRDEDMYIVRSVSVKVDQKKMPKDLSEHGGPLDEYWSGNHLKFALPKEGNFSGSDLASGSYQHFAEAVFNADNGLFGHSAIDNRCFQFNPFSGSEHELHEEYFQFIGKVVGNALRNGKLLRANFIQPIYKHIVGYPITLEDVEFIQPKIYQHLKEVEAMEGDVGKCLLTFSYSADELDEVQDVELKPGGKDLKVTNANVQEYITLTIKYFTFDQIKTQLSHFLRGLYSNFDQFYLSLFDYRQMELLICGSPFINEDDWKDNTEYTGEFADQGSSHKVVEWFWDYLGECSDAEKIKVFQFCTGTSRVPFAGFDHLEDRDGTTRLFTIEVVRNAEISYPQANKTLNRLYLPDYESEEELTENLRRACLWGLDGLRTLSVDP